jgi:hypothetical protein
MFLDGSFQHRLIACDQPVMLQFASFQVSSPAVSPVCLVDVSKLLVGVLNRWVLSILNC